MKNGPSSVYPRRFPAVPPIAPITPEVEREAERPEGCRVPSKAYTRQSRRVLALRRIARARERAASTTSAARAGVFVTCQLWAGTHARACGQGGSLRCREFVHLGKVAVPLPSTPQS